jgi:enamine deaminase RidA (YjgF/YER057c/UK114 family)
VAQPPKPVGLYEPFTRCGDLIFLSAISSARDGQLVTGKVGRDLSLEQGREAARRAADNLLVVLSMAAGADREIEAILLLRGQVNAADGFAEVHKVIDAASELIIERLGEKGRHARTAIGCSTLPNNNAVTLEAIARVRD